METMMRAAMKSLPVGYRFHPTDQELLCHYLYMKNTGQEEPFCIIPEVDICRFEPPELPRKFRESSIVEPKDPEWWFFCEQELSRTPRRSTDGGYWKKTGGTRDLRSSYSKEVIGSKKILTFLEGNSSNSTKTDWVMHEYHLPSDFPGLVLGNRKNYVLCMIKCNSNEKANSSPSHEYEQDELMNIDIAGILEPATDNGFIPEHLVQAKMQSLERLCRNQQPTLAEFAEDLTSSANSCRTRFRRASIQLDLPFSDNEVCGSFVDFSNEVIIDQDDYSSGFGTQASPNRRQGYLELQGNFTSSADSSRSRSLHGGGYSDRLGAQTLPQHILELQGNFTSSADSSHSQSLRGGGYSGRFGTQTSLNRRRHIVEFQGNFTSSASSSRSQFSLGGDSIKLDSPFAASEESNRFTDSLNQDTLAPHEQHAVIMENKQTQKAESFHGYVPIDEKKGIVEDDFPEPTVSSLREKSPEVKSKKETPNIASYKPAEAKAKKHAPSKIKVKMLSACSSSTSINKPREAAIRVEGQCRLQEINSIAALNKCEQAARELKQVATRAKPMSSSTGKRSNDEPSMVYIRNLLVGVVLFIAILYEIFSL